MATTLEEALKDVELEEGRTYAVRVRGREIEVRVKPPAAGIQDGEMMIEPWTSLPSPAGGVPSVVRPGPLPPFPTPDIPEDEGS